MNLASVKKHMLLAAVAVTLPGAALAQNDVSDEANQVAESAQQLEQDAEALDNSVTDDTLDGDLDGGVTDRLGDDRDRDDGDEGKWGLLGLLGLAGLLGLKRRDNDVHVHRDTTPPRPADRTVDPDRDGRI